MTNNHWKIDTVDLQKILARSHRKCCHCRPTPRKLKLKFKIQNSACKITSAATRSTKKGEIQGLDVGGILCSDGVCVRTWFSAWSSFCYVFITVECWSTFSCLWWIRTSLGCGDLKNCIESMIHQTWRQICSRQIWFVGFVGWCWCQKALMQVQGSSGRLDLRTSWVTWQNTFGPGSYI